MAANRLAVQGPTRQCTDTPTAGTRLMRKFIVLNKPGKKVVKEHFRALIANECESDEESE